MLVIEGTDGCGKTTLAKKIVRTQHFESHPLLYRSLGLLPGDWDYYRAYVNMMDHFVVQDRFFLSEKVYGGLIRKVNYLSDAMIKKLWRDLEMVGGLTVIITASEEVLRANYEIRKADELFTIDQILEVNKAFEELALKYTSYGENDIAICTVMHYHVKTARDFPADNPRFIDELMDQWFTQLDEIPGLD